MDFPKGELVEDREVATFDDDRLGHREIADQLAELVQSVPTPSNIALYGPWGSGKSGIGNMLSARLDPIHGLKFARFDAFKYAENPLRRNFVSIVASALGEDDRRYHEDLYTGRTNTDFVVPWRKLWNLLGIFALVIFVCALVVSAAISTVAFLQGNDPFAELLAVGAGALPASLVPATLLTAVIALIGKTFVVEKRVNRAESDEEFENLLSTLVEGSGAHRVVIFVDELDRCTSADVVETLNAVRTFLGVDKCVFIVAADQQVLERALTESLAQPTPVDALNPYYSAGSAYLDKVFQYQITVPPLMHHSITSFAVSLIDGRPGVWQCVDRRVIASILIPAHVRSPRRVKNLLNAFVLTYRLAQSRCESGQLDLDVLSSADELARLVCLRVEFPLFARDLVADPNLSDYVRELAEENADEREVWAKYRYVSPETRKIAEGYANSQRPVDKLLVEDDDSAETGASEITKVQGRQLLDYLLRTRHVTGPTKALIHLQNSGTLFGLGSAVAERIEREAQNADLVAVQQTYESLDAEGRAAALQLLVQQCRAAVGLELPNIAMSILSVAPIDHSVLADHSDEISIAVAGAVTQTPTVLTEATVDGAWQLALVGSRPESQVLGKLVADSGLAESSAELFDKLVRSGARAVEIAGSRVPDLFIDQLFGEDPDWLADLILETTEENRSPILRRAGSELTSRLTAAISAFEEAEEARAEGQEPVPDDDEPEDEVLDPSAVLGVLDRLLTDLDKRTASAEIVLRILLDVNAQSARDIVESHLPSIRTTDSDTIRKIVEQTQKRRVELWPVWLGNLSSKDVIAVPSTQSALVTLTGQLWANGATARSNDDTMRAAAAAIARLLDEADDSLLDRVQNGIDLGEPIRNDDQIDAQNRSEHVAELLVEAGLLPLAKVARHRAQLLVEGLEMDLEAQEIESPLTEYTIAAVVKALRPGTGDEGALTVEESEALVRAATKNDWFSEFDEARLRAILLTLVRPDADTASLVPDTVTTIRLYQPDLSEPGYDQLVTYWLRSTTEGVANVLEVVQERLEGDPSAQLLDATKMWSERLPVEDQYSVVEAFVSDPVRPVPEPRTLDAIGLSRIPDSSAASILIDRYSRTRSNPDRKRVLELWRLAKLSDQQARKRMLKEVMIPLIGLNAQATTVALNYLSDLATPIPSGVRKLLGEAVVSATHNSKSLESRGVQVLERLGYPVKRKGFFG